MKGFSYHDHDPHEVDQDALNQEPNLFMQDIEEQKDGLDYLIELKEVADKAFMAHETLLVRLCEILKVDYTQVTDEEVIQKVQELQDIRDDLTFDPIKQIWINTYDK